MIYFFQKGVLFEKKKSQWLNSSLICLLSALRLQLYKVSNLFFLSLNEKEYKTF